MPEAWCAAQVCVSAVRLVQDAALITRNGRVLDVIPRSELGRPDFPVHDLGPLTIVPAAINCHTHLEYSHLKGRTLLGQGFSPWARSLLQQVGEDMEDEALKAAAASLPGSGIVHVADVCSHKPRAVAAALEEAGTGFTLCGEIMGYAPLPEGALPLPRAYLEGCEELMPHVAGAGHALYSTSPQRLQRAHAWSLERGRPFFLHLAEHEEEVFLLQQGRGALAGQLRKGLLPRDWRAPGMRPVAYAQELGLLGSGTVAVHCVQLDAEDIAMLAESGATVCLCPRSNANMGVGAAPWDELFAAGVPCCLGTDSLASNNDLDIFAELRHILRHIRIRPERLWCQLVSLVSGHGARVLGLRDVGSLEPGRRACWVALSTELELADCWQQKEKRN